MDKIISNKIKKRETSSSFLKNRINLNKKFQKSNFTSWQLQTYRNIFKKLLKTKKSSTKILDVGAGDGLQVSYFLKIFKNPEIWCLDYSKKSLKSLSQKYKHKNIKIIHKNMDNLDDLIKKKKLKRYFDIAHSSYALYYAKNPKLVLKSMKTSLSDGGLFLVSAPSEPHEMVNFINKVYKIPAKILKTLKFYKNILIPFLKQNGKNTILIKKINYLNFQRGSDFLNFWKNTTYYNVTAKDIILKKLNKRKSLKFKKISSIAAAIKSINNKVK